MRHDGSDAGAILKHWGGCREVCGQANDFSIECEYTWSNNQLFLIWSVLFTQFFLEQGSHEKIKERSWKSNGKRFLRVCGNPYEDLRYSCDNQESIETAHLNNFFSLFQVYYYRPLLLNYKNPVVRIHVPRGRVNSDARALDL